MIRRRIPRVIAATLLALAVTWPCLRPNADPAYGASDRDPEWPRTIDGESLHPLALSAVEARFAARFPGAIGRFTSDDATWILRHVERPTRMLHPATDCYRGLGYSIRDERLYAAKRGLERCFVAARGSLELDVCERIIDRNGNAFTDTSAWYWHAALGRSRGPWLAVTRTALRPVVQNQ